MLQNISDIHSCYGCGVCAIACSKQIINLHLNKDGFYEPYISEPDKCTDCGLCREVCSYCHAEIALEENPKVAWGAWSKEEGVRRVSASGGVGFEIGRTLIARGYQAVSVRYNPQKNQAEHYVASTVEEFLPSMGSKYIQSYTLDGFKAVNRKGKYLVTGTPCQIDSFRRYIRKFRCEDNFILMDFFCHGVPSKWVWDKYIKELRNNLGEIDHVAWRNKLNGWHDSWTVVVDGKESKGEVVNWHGSYNMLIRGKKGFINSRWTEGDSFYNMFLGNNCLGKACYKKCKFKYDHSSADIRIGDMWGGTYHNDEKGVTACVAFTQKGVDALKETTCEYHEFPFDTVAEGQVKEAMKYPFGWKLIINMSKSDRISMKLLVLANRIVGKLNRIVK